MANDPRSPGSKRFPRVGVGVIVRKGDEVLLIKRAHSHGSGTWSTPGGHLDFGESPAECAARETLEETGVTVGDLSLLALTNDVFVAEEKHYITLWMEGVYDAGQAVVNAAHEMTDVGWFSWGDLPNPLFLPLQNLLTGQCYAVSNSKRINRDD